MALTFGAFTCAQQGLYINWFTLVIHYLSCFVSILAVNVLFRIIHSLSRKETGQSQCRLQLLAYFFAFAEALWLLQKQIQPIGGSMASYIRFGTSNNEIEETGRAEAVSLLFCLSLWIPFVCADLPAIFHRWLLACLYWYWKLERNREQAPVFEQGFRCQHHLDITYLWLSHERFWLWHL